MDPNWNDNQPIYRQLRDRMVALILEGALKEGDPSPSVRTVAADYRLNPLTVLKGYQQLVDEQLVEKRRGLGMFVSVGARKALMKDERQRFLEEERGWPTDFLDALGPYLDEVKVRLRDPVAHGRVLEISEREVSELRATLMHGFAGGAGVLHRLAFPR